MGLSASESQACLLIGSAFPPLLLPLHHRDDSGLSVDCSHRISTRSVLCVIYQNDHGAGEEPVFLVLWCFLHGQVPHCSSDVVTKPDAGFSSDSVGFEVGRWSRGWSI